jgi:hypothetical protein
MIKTKNVKVIDVSDWDELVEKTYGRPYSFQQQDGCKSRQHVGISVPSEYVDDFENDTVPEVVNHSEMGVSFKAWLERDPKQSLPGRDDKDNFSLVLWWERNFYPNVDMVINDLHSKGLLKAGEYEIDIDW